MYSIVYLYDANGSPIGFKYRLYTYAENVWDEYFYEKNLHGDVVAVYNAAGTKLISYAYNAWGEFVTTYHNGGDNTTAVNNPYLYRGYYYDSDLGLYYLQSRYYDPTTSRFINADDCLGANQDILSYNLYAYCSNNPIKYVDPSGHSMILIALAVGVVAGFVGTSIADVADDGNIFNGSIDAITYIANSSVCAAVAVVGALIPGMLGTAITMPQSSAAIVISATGTVAVISSAVLLFASNYRPGDNTKQNKQFNDAMRELQIKDKDTMRRIHDAIQGENLGYKELIEFIKVFLNLN